MQKINKVLFSLLTAFMTINLSACNFVGQTYGEHGFLRGLWHGSIAIVALVVSLFTNVGIYECHNTGFFYNFSFLLGAVLFSWNFGIIAGLVSIVLLILGIVPFQ